jgi:hypothetical protein
MSKYKNDRAWSDEYIPTIKRIVGPYLLEPAPIEEDCKRATDLIILAARDKRIACRMRRPGYAEKYPYDFTVRSERDSGAETELSKLVNGYGDWMFYGHAAPIGAGRISRWMLIDLHSWRAHLIRAEDRTRVVPVSNDNGDGTRFLAFDVRKFCGRPPILVASSNLEDMRVTA